MKFQDIHALVKDHPCIQPEEALRLYQTVIDNKIRQVLEIGVYHGKSSCYLAAALQENDGKLVSLDVPQILRLEPNAKTLLQRAGLESIVDLRVSAKGSAWELRNLIAQNRDAAGKVKPLFDLCFIDGHHGWEFVALDFCLARLLLKPGGWIIFDDVNWRYSTSPSLKDTPATAALPEDYRNNPHVRDVLELLVSEDASFEKPAYWKSWAISRKTT
jgi:predicted O-methyltransferase YrrM